jgi:hypothetical protein
MKIEVTPKKAHFYKKKLMLNVKIKKENKAKEKILTPINFFKPITQQKQRSSIPNKSNAK